MDTTQNAYRPETKTTCPQQQGVETHNGLTNKQIELMHHLIRAHLQQGNFERVCQMGELLLDRNLGSPWLSNRLGRAYYGLRQMDLAKKHLGSCLPQVPRIDHMRLALTSLRAGSESFKIQEEYEELARRGVTRHSFIDGLAPILWSTRPVTGLFLDQFSILSRPGSAAGDLCLADTAHPDTVPVHIRIRMAFLELARYLYGRYGIFTAFMRYPEFCGDRCVPLAKVFFSKDATLIERINELESMTWREMTDSDAETQIRTASLVPEGRLLGYPDCCIEWVRSKRSQHVSYEVEAIRALLEQENALDTGRIQLYPDPAYFAFEFYPCHPRCSAAESQGREIEKRYQAVDPELASLYQNYALELNKARILWSDETYENVLARFHTPPEKYGRESDGE